MWSLSRLGDLRSDIWDADLGSLERIIWAAKANSSVDRLARSFRSELLPSTLAGLRAGFNPRISNTSLLPKRHR
ncbi:hypothetical protein AG1IA_00433 [Rhizoctonia solani AG-1 IA]|uniref:Uncharacterized protein n=1 Tax=Thanatephorus cucumeris (strain AG1-IA) TaxID=983506 RepID=L8X5S0_THACA|nr:hypothetical protein AG1IA_00433 [Rhizoctonia solani AG-1 IA]